MSDDFTSQIFAFLRQVFADKALHPTAFKLAFAISQYVNRKTRKAWPELPTLASAAGISKRTVIRLIEGLEANGHLQVERHRVRGRNRSNTYRLNIKKGDTGDIFSDDEKVSSRSPFQDGKGDIQRAKRCHPAHEKVSPMSPEPTSEPSEEPRGEIAAFCRRAADAAPPEVEGFAEFWQLWQRGHGDDRAKVRKAFSAAVAEHGAGAILASAARWAAAREPRYLPEPVKWLAGVWQSEPAPIRRSRNGGSRNKASPSMEALRAGGFPVDGWDA